MNKNKIRIIICVIIGVTLIGSCIYGINMRMGWKDDVQLRDYISKPDAKLYFSDGQQGDVLKEPAQVNTFKGLYDLADVIAHVRVNKDGRRERYSECIVSEVEVIETYKGSIDEKIIDIIEPAQIYKSSRNVVDSVMGYTLMEDESEYIMFLFKRPYKGYGKKDVYTPTTATLSKYNYDANTDSITGKAFLAKNIYEGQEFPYSLYAKYDAVTEDNNVVDFYNNNVLEINRLLSEGKN